jgi:calcium permeable stress-gated cation channel
MFLLLGLLGIAVLIPVNVTQGNKAITNGLDAFAIMTPLFIFGGGLWAQVVVAWLLDLVVMFFLWHNYRRVHKLRRAYLESPEYQNSLHARTLLIRDIPGQFRNNEGIMRVTDEVNPTGAAPRTTIGRNVKVLPELIEQHEEAVKELESVLAKYLKNPDKIPPNRPLMKPSGKYRGQTKGGKVDAIDHLTDRIRALEMEISDVRERVDNRDAMPYGFASWDQISQAHTVAFQARSKRPQGAKIQLAPKPNDLIWDNLKLSRGSRKTKRIMNAVWIAVLTIVWTPINAGIAIFLSNLSNLGLVWPAFKTQLQEHHTGWSIVQGIAAPAITSLFYLLLPSIFRRLQIRAGDVTKTERERHVFRNLYSFFTLNNLVVFSIFSAVWQYVTIVIQYNKESNDLWSSLRKGQFFLVITTTLCQISPFWVTWLLQRNLGAATDLAQLWQLTYVWFARTFMAPTPRQNIEWTKPPSFDYASYYNYFIFYATVALCYATLQPIVLVVTALYFSIDAFLKKYLLMYVFVTKTESGGQFWVTMFNRLVFAAMLSNVVIAVVVKARGTWTLVAAIAPLLVILVAFKWYCMKTFDLDLKYYARGGMQDQERFAGDSKSHRTDKISSKFGHPALTQPLMTPMVHAKAKHVLAEIYHGRLDSEAGHGIAMQPMAESSKPPQNVPFEFVSEAQQDFQFYKNREDFRGEAGDDLLSQSRAQTPAPSIGKQDFGSGPSTRETSPAPLVSRVPVGAYSNVRVAPVEGDLGMRHGPYTDPYDDRTNLLGSAGDMPTPHGEFISMDRFRTPGTSRDGSEYHDNTPRNEGGYDYFRAQR